MAILTIASSGKTFDAPEGASILQVLLDGGEDINHTCGGEAKCGSCHIFVQEGRKGVSRISREENEKLDSIVGVGSKSRLACQAKLLGTENVTIELLTFASGF